ncbi:MAG: hypothetical protein WCW87_02060 [Candidatus Paceibacterota bacterium]
MTPISVIERRIYLVIMSVLFITIIPVIILYSIGYRLDKGLSIVKTGGVLVTLDKSNISVYINDEKLNESGIFSRSFLFQNLHPEKYKIVASKDGYYPWQKQLMVYEEKVTESHPFLLPLEPTLNEIPKTIASTKKTLLSKATTTSTTVVSNPEYKTVLALFSAKALKMSAISTTTIIVRKNDSLVSTSTDTLPKDSVLRQNIVLWKENGVLSASWWGNLSDIPYFFCDREPCKTDIVIYNNNSVKYFDFFPGRNDLIIFETNDGVFVTEIDGRSKRNIEPLYPKSNAEFRIKDNETIYIKDDKVLYQLVLN